MSTLNLFSELEVEERLRAENVNAEQVRNIKGLQYVPNFITLDEHDQIVAVIDDNCQTLWSAELKRRVQHYGYRYDYKARRVDYEMRVGELPWWLKSLSSRLKNEGYFTRTPDQVIVNEYLPGQGISPHVDCQPCFDDTVVSLSLLTDCVMELSNLVTKEKVPVLLEVRSIVVLKDDARYRWYHGIPARHTDFFNGRKIERSRRVSLTFRNVVLSR